MYEYLRQQVLPHGIVNHTSVDVDLIQGDVHCTNTPSHAVLEDLEVVFTERLEPTMNGQGTQGVM